MLDEDGTEFADLVARTTLQAFGLVDDGARVAPLARHPGFANALGRYTADMAAVSGAHESLFPCLLQPGDLVRLSDRLEIDACGAAGEPFSRRTLDACLERPPEAR